MAGTLLVLVCALLIHVAWAGPPGAPADDLRHRIGAYLRRLEKHGLAAAVLVARDREIVLVEGYGESNESHDPITPETTFDIGSLAKTFTGVLILRLEDQGVLSTADPLRKYFPDVPEEKASITLKNLLTHSMGMVDHFERDDEPLTREEAVRRLYSMPLKFEPGTKYEYSNLAYTTLAMIVEKIGGQPYPDYLRKTLWDPLGMTSTGFYGDPRIEGTPSASGYLNGRLKSGPASQTPGPYWTVIGNGGIVSTVGDLYKFVADLGENRIISESVADRLCSEWRDEGDGSSFYGAGCTVWHWPEGIGHGHTGLSSLTWGNASFLWSPDKGWVVIALSNRTRIPFFFGIPLPLRWWIHIYGTDTAEALFRNLVAGDPVFERLPRFAK